MPLFRNIHHNPEFFSDPENFDPFRFEVRNETLLCPFFFIAESSVTLHFFGRILQNLTHTCHLVTEYMLVQEMNLQSLRCLFYSTTCLQSTGMMLTYKNRWELVGSADFVIIDKKK